MSVSDTGSKQPQSWFERQPKGGFYAALIWSLAALSFGYAFFHRVAPSVMVTDLMTEFAIGGAMLGVLSALYFYPYVLLQIPLGALLETVGARILLTLALCTAGAGSLLFGFADSLYMAYFGRILIGIGCGVGFLGSLALAARWFPPSRFGFLAGLTMFIGMGSGILAQGPLALFVGNYGWRTSLLMLGAFGFVLAAVIFLLVRNQPFGTDSPASARRAANAAAICPETGRPQPGGMEDCACRCDHVGADAGAGRIMGNALYDASLWARPAGSGFSGLALAFGLGAGRASGAGCLTVWAKGGLF